MVFILFAVISICHADHYEDSSYRLYTIKQGVIHYKTGATIGGSENMVIYFDRFGSRQAIQMSAPSGVNLGPAKVLQIDGVQYTMLDNSQCLKSKRKSEFSVANVDFMKLNSSSIEKYGIKKIGTIIFLNRICNKYILATKDGVLNGEIIEWQDIPLSIKIRNKGILQETVAYKVDTVTNLSSTLFELPKNIQIIDGTNINNH
jgi:hypothetical protein